MRLGVYRSGGIGDSLLLAPMLRAVREMYPDIEIDLWCYQEAGEILGMAGLVEWWSHVHNGIRPHKPLDAFLGFDLHHETLKREMAVYNIPKIMTFHAWSPYGIHAADWYVHGAHLLLGTPATINKTTELRIGFGHLKKAMLPALGSVILHPGASAPFRRWPMERFRAVAEELERRGYRVMTIEWDGAHDWFGRHNPTRSLSFPALGAALQQCTLFIGNDSGPAHLASMLGTQTISIFGPYPSWQTSPIGPRTHIITGSPDIESGKGFNYVSDHWENATVDVVLGKATSLLCEPSTSPSSPSVKKR